MTVLRLEVPSVMTQGILLGVIAVSDHLILADGELPSRVVHAPGQCRSLPAKEVIDGVGGLIEDHHVFDINPVRGAEPPQLKLGVPL